MAFELLNSGIFGLVAGENIIESTTEQRPVAMLLHVAEIAGCTIRVQSRVMYGGFIPGIVFDSGEILVEAGNADVVLEPVPVARSLEVIVTLVSGTPADSIMWDLFGL